MMKIRFFDLDRWEEIFLTLKTNKLRSLLTAFGIFWGVFMLILLMGGSNGLKTMLGSTFTGFATNSYFIMPAKTDLPYKGFQKGRSWKLETTDLQRLRNQIPELETITPVFSLWGAKATVGSRQMDCDMKGVDADFTQVENADMTQGRFLNESDIQARRKVCVIGKRVAEELFPGISNPCGMRIQVKGVYFQVIGVNSRSGASLMGNAETSIQTPYTTLQRIYHMGNEVQCIGMTVKKGYTVSEVAPKVDAFIKRIHLIHPDDQQALFGMNMEMMFQMIDNLFRGISILVWMIGLGTLFTGAVGVSNIMMVTVRERTNEIGIRRAIGAKPKDIMWQILSESMVLTVLAGLSGIVSAVWLLQGIENIMAARNNLDASFQISFFIAIGAAVFVAFLGVLAGMAPAFRALAIKPIDAMRDE